MVVASRTLSKIVTLTKSIAKIFINICRARCASGRKTLIPKEKSQKKKPFLTLCPVMQKILTKYYFFFYMQKFTVRKISQFGWYAELSRTPLCSTAGVL